MSLPTGSSATLRPHCDSLLVSKIASKYFLNDHGSDLKNLQFNRSKTVWRQGWGQEGVVGGREVLVRGGSYNLRQTSWHTFPLLQYLSGKFISSCPSPQFTVVYRNEVVIARLQLCRGREGPPYSNNVIMLRQGKRLSPISTFFSLVSSRAFRDGPHARFMCGNPNQCLRNFLKMLLLALLQI